MRLFVGVWISPTMRNELEGFLRPMPRDFPHYKWTSPKNLHFTLKFLGDVNPERVPDLKKALSRCAAGVEKFQLKLGRIGYFPDNTTPNIVWIGINNGRTELVNLGKNVDGACAEVGFPRENRPFQPHLTIARARSGEGVHSGARVHSGGGTGSGSCGCPESDMIFDSLTDVGCFSLIESRLMPGGPVYSSVADFPFGGTNASGAI